MPGRCQAKSGYNRGGRGRGNKPRFHNNRKKPKDETKKGLKDYTYYVGNNRQATDFETTTEFIINHIKKTYSHGIDIAAALSSMTPVDTSTWKPSLEMSLETDDQLRNNENRQFEIEFKELNSRYLTRLDNYEQNAIKAYALIWERCSQAMKDKIANLSNFETAIENDPIELLKEIKRNALNYQEYKYDMSILYDAFRHLLTTRQQDQESLQEYARRFKTSEEILRSHLGGPIIMTSVVRRHDEYETAEENMDFQKVQEIQDEVYQRFLSYTFLKQSDQTKYGTLIHGLDTQHSLANNQYPTTMSETTNVLSNHRFDETYHEKIKKLNRNKNNKTRRAMKKKKTRK